MDPQFCPHILISIRKLKKNYSLVGYSRLYPYTETSDLRCVAFCKYARIKGLHNFICRFVCFCNISSRFIIYLYVAD